MKPFNLEAAKEGKPIVTRDGQVAKFVAHVPEAREDQQLVILINGTVCTRSDTGLSSVGWKTSGDLMMAEEEVTVYFNEYENGFLGSPVWDEKHLPTTPKVVKVHTVKIKV